MRLSSRAVSLLKASLRPSSAFIARLSPAAPGICTSCLLASVSPIPAGARAYASDSASSKRWVARQVADPYTRAAKTEQLRSRAGFKLMQLNHTHKFLKPGMTVVDLGYAPGAWTEVAIQYTKPNSRVIGVDILPSVPPPGASTFQGNFLCEKVQHSLKLFLASAGRGRSQKHFMDGHGYLEAEREEEGGRAGLHGIRDDNVGKNTVDVVLSDMCEPWPLKVGQWVNGIKQPYVRLMNVSGLKTRDHVHSIDLCVSALLFCIDVLKPGGDFVCKYYSGGHDKEFETGLKRAFEKVTREKPESSRPESREGYFVAKMKKGSVTKEQVLAVMPNLV
ncbi:FtsJ-like methyltransferase-domain-containing protein [Tirmania nivea]|nr:FtsJ-like methyltransferase-domain-containing protein [Tirmania nivea]